MCDYVQAVQKEIIQGLWGLALIGGLHFLGLCPQFEPVLYLQDVKLVHTHQSVIYPSMHILTTFFLILGNRMLYKFPKWNQ